jgi:hypothetical protein
MTTLEKTSAEIRRLVPRLMEETRNCKFLYTKGFGCLNKPYTVVCIIDDNELDYMHRIIRFHFNRPGDGDRVEKVFFVAHKNSKSHTGLDQEKEWNDCKIIGHPITLEDVLEAIKEQHPYKNLSYVDNRCNEVISGITLDVITSWQYGKPYDQQSPEVHEFVADILFNS